MNIQKTWFCVVKPALAATFAVLLAAGAVNAEADVQKAQRLLNALGFDAGSVDGQWGKKSENALSEFMTSQNQTFDGNLDQNELDVLQAVATAKNISTKPLSAVEIENADLNFAYAPLSPGKMSRKYWWTEAWFQADWNNDGLDDVMYIGVMRPENAKMVGVDTGGACDNKKCGGVMPGPTLYLQNADGNFYEKSILLRDQREISGQSLSKQSLVGDLNGDRRLDLYIADTGVGTHNGMRDSYFLSQPDGTWLESSDTHLSDPNLAIFDHGGAIGDIDGDGDLDIVLTELKNSLICWVNSGDGHLRKKKCGTVNAFGIELADMDGDGDLDLIHAGHEYGGSSPTGISWNDGLGKFSGNLKLPIVKDWGTVPEVSAWDLDSDGDMDIVISRAGKLYVGTGIQVLENLGSNDYKSTFFPLIVAPDDYVPKHEGNEWNDYVQAIRFSDVDRDGLTDIVFVGGGYSERSSRVRGAFLKNQGSMTFKHIYGGVSDNPLTVLSASKFYDDGSSTTKQNVQLADSEVITIANKAFSKYSSGMIFASVSDDNFDTFDHSLLMPISGAVLLGVDNLYIKDSHGDFDLITKWGGKTFPVSVCFDYYAEQKFLAFRVNFSLRGGFGGLKELSVYGTNSCQFQIGKAVGVWEVSDKANEVGFHSFLEDLQSNGLAVLENMPGLSEIERGNLLDRFN